jgi:hypothetical protein
LCPSTKLKRHSAPIRVGFWTYLLETKLISWVLAPSAVVQQPFGITDQQRDDAYAQWLQGMFLFRFQEAMFPIAFLSHAAGLQGGLQGMLQYQVRH